MTSFRWHKISETVWKVKLGRDEIGWASLYGNVWKASVLVSGTTGKASGASATIAIQTAIKNFVEARAVKRGFKSRDDELNQHNESVRKEAASMNAMLASAGIGMRVKLRSTKCI